MLRHFAPFDRLDWEWVGGGGGWLVAIRTYWKFTFQIQLYSITLLASVEYPLDWIDRALFKIKIARHRPASQSPPSLASRECINIYIWVNIYRYGWLSTPHPLAIKSNAILQLIVSLLDDDFYRGFAAKSGGVWCAHLLRTETDCIHRWGRMEVCTADWLATKTFRQIHNSLNPIAGNKLLLRISMGHVSNYIERGWKSYLNRPIITVDRP